MADTIVHRLGMIAYPRGDLKYTVYWQISRVCCRIVASAVIQKQTSDIASTRCVHDDMVRHSKVVCLILLLILVLYVALCEHAAWRPKEIKPPSVNDTYEHATWRPKEIKLPSVNGMYEGECSTNFPQLIQASAAFGRACFAAH